MADKASAIRSERIVQGIALRRFVEDLLTDFTAPDLVGVFNRVTGFMAQDAQAPVRRISFHFQYLGLSKLRQTGIGEVERHGDAGDTIGSKPLA